MSVIGLIFGLILIGLFGWLMVVNIIGIVKQFKAKKQNKVPPVSVAVGEESDDGKKEEK